MKRVGALAIVIALTSTGCGAGNASRAARLTDDLSGVIEASAGTDGARRTRDAIEDTREAERRGLVLEADEHASRARAWAEVDVSEREVVALEDELGRLEAELLGIEAEASGVEHEGEVARREALARSEANAMREELARALARAEADEGVPRRARRVGLSEGPEVRRMADVLADRARVIAAAARSMGASSESLAAADQAIAAIAAEEEPTARLSLADRAHGLTRVALADARQRLGATPTAEEIEALREALETEGFPALRDEHGLGARVPEAFDGNAIAAAQRGRLRHLAEIVASHPAGPILLAVEADGTREAQAQAQRRLDALRRAILGDRTREVVVSVAVETRVPGSTAATAPNAARVVLPAYVPRAPVPVAPIEASAPSSGEGGEPESE